MNTTLTELLTPRNRATLEAMLMSVLQGATIEGQPGTSFPVTDWIPGSLERTNLKMTVTGLLDREDMIKMLTASGFLDLAATLVDADGNPIEGWMEILAAQNYGRTRNDATYTRQLLTLTCTSGPGPYTRAAGEIIARSPVTGNRYTNEAEVTIPDGGSVTSVFKAEGPGSSYVDATGTIIDLVTPGLPGVTVTNASTYTPGSSGTWGKAIEQTFTAIGTHFEVSAHARFMASAAGVDYSHLCGLKILADSGSTASTTQGPIDWTQGWSGHMFSNTTIPGWTDPATQTFIGTSSTEANFTLAEGTVAISAAVYQYGSHSSSCTVPAGEMVVYVDVFK